MSSNDLSHVPDITADELRTALEDGKPIHVLDVRPVEEFEEWHVPGSRHIGGYDALKEGQHDVYDDLSLPDDEPVVTVCGAGKTSATAARTLREQGKEAYSLQGGLRAWTFAWNVAETSFRGTGADVIQIRRTGKGCLSYLIGSGEETLVIDPSVSPEIYEQEADRRGWKIIGVLDTHIHADHLSRARRLADATGASLYLPENERISFDYRSVGDGEVIEVGSTNVTALRTPGHTPESTTYRLGADALFTGDTLFLESVGRPDLDADREGGKRKARQLYHSLQRLLRHPDDTAVLPGHTSSPVPFDGEIVGAPLGTVKTEVEAFQWTEDRFVEKILDRVPPTPPNHETIITRNERGGWPDETDLIDLEAGANRCAVG